MSIVKVQALGKDNYDTWCIHAKAYLVNNKLWKYVKDIPGEDATQEILDEDEMAKSELMLLIAPSELKQVKNCKYAKDVWTTLESIYASKGPARKPTLLKQLILAKLEEGEDVREHLKKFMDTVDKLQDLNIDINNDLLSIMMLYSLSQEFENFRTAIESQDTLPYPEKLKIKIIEESDARRRDTASTSATNNHEDCFYTFCKICKKKGHDASKCWSKNKNINKKNKKPKSNFSKVDQKETNLFSCYIANKNAQKYWILDSGCTSHMTYSEKPFTELKRISKTLNLASEDKTAEIKGTGPAEIEIKEGRIGITNALYVPSLCANLLSVGKMTDKGLTILFNNKKAIIKDHKRGVQMEAIRKDDGLYYLQTENNDVKRHKANAAECSNNDRKNTESDDTEIKLSENPPHQFHRRTKHIKQKHFFIRECIENGDLRVKQVSTELQLADMFTKPLFGPRLDMLSCRVGLKDLSKLQKVPWM